MISDHNKKLLSALEQKIGILGLRELQFKIADGGNTWKLAGEYGIEKYEVNFLRNQPEVLTVYLHEADRPTALRVVYQRDAA